MNKTNFIAKGVEVVKRGDKTTFLINHNDYGVNVNDITLEAFECKII